MVTRAELVRDWQYRLAEADAATHCSTKLGWLHRVQRRLYRFLLAFYGTGNWQEDERHSSGESEPDLFADVALSGGRPARPVEKMRVVLTALAKAQDHPAQAGPLRRGLFADDWMVLASGRKIPAEEYVEFLRRKQITSRIVHWGRVRAVEVQAAQFHAARQRLQEYLDAVAVRESGRARPYQPSPLVLFGLFRIYARETCVIIKSRDNSSDHFAVLFFVQAPLVTFYTTCVLMVIQPAINRLALFPFTIETAFSVPVYLVSGWTACVIVGSFHIWQQRRYSTRMAEVLNIPPEVASPPLDGP